MSEHGGGGVYVSMLSCTDCWSFTCSLHYFEGIQTYREISQIFFKFYVFFLQKLRIFVALRVCEREVVHVHFKRQHQNELLTGGNKDG